MFVVGAASSAEIIALEVDRDQRMIKVRSEILFDAPRVQVFAALSDYERFEDLSSRFTASRFLEPAADGTPRVYTRVEGCVLFFCRSVERCARLQAIAPVEIEAMAEPESSDVEYGYEHWLLETEGEGTRVIYTHEFDPDFWVPPLLGIWVIRTALEDDAQKAANRLELMAQRWHSEDREQSDYSD